MNSEDAFLTVDEAIEIIEAALKSESLSNVQQDMFSKIWEGKTYDKIAEELDYQPEYIKYVGFQLWRSLTNAFGEKVNKSNFRSVLRRYKRDIKIQEVDNEESNLTINSQTKICIDWGEVIDVSIFFGRVDELTTLSQWILQDECRLVALLGMGGIGKTSLAAKLAAQTQGEFTYLIWRSLRYAPSLLRLLTDINNFFPSASQTEIPTTIDAQLSHLLHTLRTHRCLLILDDWESILRDTDIAGYYRQGYEDYGELLKRVGQERHKSSLLLLSREKPIEIASLAGESLPIRALQLKGLKLIDAKQLLVTKGFAGTENALDELIQLYRGHPAALKIIATTIKDLFNGNVSEFMGQSSLVIGDIFANLLHQHFERLSDLEEAIIYWLAIARQSLSLIQLKANFKVGVSSSELLAALESLGRRSLIEKEAASSDSRGTGIFNRAIATYQAVADKIGEADTLIKIAGVYFRDVRYYRSIDAGDSLQIALDYYQKALAIYRDVEDKHGVGLALNNLGLVYFCLEKNDKALHPLQEALSLSREIKFLTVEGSSLHNIGWIKENLGRAKDIGSDEQPFYENLDLVEQALASYQQALDIHRQINDKAGISDTLRNIGATYENRQQFNEARTCYQQAITGYKELGDRTSISDIISKTKIPNLLNRDDPFFPPLQASMSGRTDDGGSPKIIESKKKP